MSSLRSTKLKNQYKRKRWTIGVLSLIILLSIYFFKDSFVIFRALVTVAGLILFYVLDHTFDIRFKKMHYFFIIIILSSSILLSPIYFLHPQYDKAQHFVQPILVAIMIFYMIDKLKLEDKWKILFTLFTVGSIIGLFELGEYTLDKLFDMKLQGVYLRDFSGFGKLNLVVDKLDDTMWDIFFGTLGTSLYGIYKGIKLRKNKN